MVKATDYAYAVARIRANEAKLFTRSDFEGLISSRSIKECFDFLASKGIFDRAKDKDDINSLVRRLSDELWALLNESVPEKSVLSVFCVRNDFFNLKAALKCSIEGIEPDGLFKTPTTFDLEALKESVEKQDFSLLGELYAEDAKKAFNAATVTENGQSLDIILDRAALKMMSDFKEKLNDSLTGKIMNFLIGCADLKIAVRAARTKKTKGFAEMCMFPCEGLDVAKLAEAVEKGEEAVFELLKRSDFAEGAALLSKSSVEFEKWLDDRVTEITREAKFMFFGFEPIIAYYYAKTNEINLIRMILSAKQNGLSNEIIRERMRVLYV